MNTKDTPRNHAVGIFGPEHSGTKALLNIIIDGFGANGKRGNCGHGKMFEDSPLYCFKYSLPSGHPTMGPWPSPKDTMVDMLMANYKKITVLIPTRNNWCLHQSQIRDPKRVTTEDIDVTFSRHKEVLDRMIQSSYANVVADCQSMGVPFHFVSYEDMVANTARFLRSLSYILDEPLINERVAVFDANAKYNALLSNKDYLLKKEKQ
jgi:hypothetical protein